MPDFALVSPPESPRKARCLDELIEASIARLRAFEPAEGYWLSDSYGKDSCVLRWIAQQAGVRFDAHYQRTSVDPPELVRFGREHHPDTIIERPAMTMWKLIEKELYPPSARGSNNNGRYCCKVLKEQGGNGRRVLTGVRWDESRARQRWMVENYIEARQTLLINPILDWTERDIWSLIHRERIPYCELYNQGMFRLGCICCPLQGSKGMQWDAARWPKYAEAYRRTFDRVIAIRKERDMRCTWSDGADMFNWWVRNEPEHGQGCFLYE